MRTLVIRSFRFGVPAWYAWLTMLLVVTLGPVPAQAQDFFGFFRRLFSPPVARSLFYDTRPYGSVHFERRVRRSTLVPHEPPTRKLLKVKAPGEVTNPVPELLADPTLHRGDVVMFPTGPHVFMGRSGTQHTLSDFQPVARAGSAVPLSTRSVVANFRPGANDAWRVENGTSRDRLAETTNEISATRSSR